ncbi:Hypothetical protein KVN_LOCUS268 [uncultured virus]|nr:Hypothetical protein KVN_LOCUS268 [uncultured virus]
MNKSDIDNAAELIKNQLNGNTDSSSFSILSNMLDIIKVELNEMDINSENMIDKITNMSIKIAKDIDWQIKKENVDPSELLNSITKIQKKNNENVDQPEFFNSITKIQKKSMQDLLNEFSKYEFKDVDEELSNYEDKNFEQNIEINDENIKTNDEIIKDIEDLNIII